jgi:hypothetical protein
MAGILLLVGGSLPVPDSFGADFRRRAVCAKLPRMNVASDTLYEEDFYAWTQQQADLLRRLPAECPYTLVQIIGSGETGSRSLGQIVIPGRGRRPRPGIHERWP